MITEWTFIASVDQGTLVECINEYIEEGWQPYGGVGIAFEGGGDLVLCHYTQAMVKLDNVSD